MYHYFDSQVEGSWQLLLSGGNHKPIHLFNAGVYLRTSLHSNTCNLAYCLNNRNRNAGGEVHVYGDTYQSRFTQNGSDGRVGSGRPGPANVCRPIGQMGR